MPGAVAFGASWVACAGGDRELIHAAYIIHPFPLEGTLNKAGPNPFDKKPTLGFSAHGALKRSDYGITGLTPMIGDDVSITIEAEFNHAP